MERTSTRQALLNSAAAVLARNPGAALAEIARDAGVGRATLHRWFPSGADLRRELALDALRACDDACADIEARTSTATAALREVIRALVPLGDRFRFLSSDPGVMNDPAVKAVYDRQMAETAELIEAVKAEKGIDRAVPTAWVAASLDALIFTAWETVRNGQVAQNDAAALVERTLLHGLHHEENQ